MKTTVRGTWIWEEFFNLVHKMHIRQRKYFSTRSHGSLREAKDSEKAVDNYMDYHLNELAGKPQQEDLYE
jgi:hypothetical protein